MGLAFCEESCETEKSGMATVSGQDEEYSEIDDANPPIEKKIPGFEFLNEEPFSCGGQTNTMKSYRHKQTGLEFVLIPGGSFRMGSDFGNDNEVPVHDVTVKAFMICRTEVTQSVWKKVMGTTPWEGKDEVEEGPDHPATYISWHDGVSFCEKTGLRLPTEAEWEYACRAGTSTDFYFGNAESDLCKYGNYCDQSHIDDRWGQDKAHDDGHDKEAPVMRYKANAFGLFDMHGNVWEWCQDREHRDYSGAPTDGSSWETWGKHGRIGRGGSWFSGARDCRSALRAGGFPGPRLYGRGFRPALSYPPAPETSSARTGSGTASSPSTKGRPQLIDLPAPGSKNHPRTMFIASTTEPWPVPNSYDKWAMLWEIRLDRARVPLVLCHSLGPCSRRAAPLLDSPKLLVLETWAKNKKRGRAVSSCHKILKVDYTPFGFEKVFDAEKIHTIDRAGNLIYLKADDYQSFKTDLLVFDRMTLKVMNPESIFELMAQSGDRWLVNIDGHFAIFNAKDNRVIERFSEIPDVIKRFSGPTRYSSARTFWNGGRYVVSLGALLDEEKKRFHPYYIREHVGKIVYQVMTVWDLTEGLKYTLNVRTKVGSLLSRASHIYVRVEMDQDRMRYTERRSDCTDAPEGAGYEDLHEWVTVDLETGEELGREPYTYKKPTHEELGVPEYLRELYDNPPYPMLRRKRLAYAFLTWHGVVIKDDYYFSKLDAVCGSSDDREWLILDNGIFYYGNLENRFLYQWPAPDSIKSNDVELYAIDL